MAGPAPGPAGPGCHRWPRSRQEAAAGPLEQRWAEEGRGEPPRAGQVVVDRAGPVALVGRPVAGQVGQVGPVAEVET